MKYIVYTSNFAANPKHPNFSQHGFCKHVGLGLDIPDDHQHQLPAYQPRNAKDLHPVNSYINKLSGI